VDVEFFVALLGAQVGKVLKEVAHGGVFGIHCGAEGRPAAGGREDEG